MEYDSVLIKIRLNINVSLKGRFHISKGKFLELTLIVFKGK